MLLLFSNINNKYLSSDIITVMCVLIWDKVGLCWVLQMAWGTLTVVFCNATISVGMHIRFLYQSINDYFPYSLPLNQSSIVIKEFKMKKTDM